MAQHLGTTVQDVGSRFRVGAPFRGCGVSDALGRAAAQQLCDGVGGYVPGLPSTGLIDPRDDVGVAWRGQHTGCPVAEQNAAAGVIEHVVAVLGAGKIEIRLFDPGHPDFGELARSRIGDGADIGVGESLREKLVVQHQIFHLGLRTGQLANLDGLAGDHRDLLEKERLVRLSGAGAERLIVHRL
jgi:hypothetical protein